MQKRHASSSDLDAATVAEESGCVGADARTVCGILPGMVAMRP